MISWAHIIASVNADSAVHLKAGVVPGLDQLERDGTLIGHPAMHWIIVAARTVGYPRTISTIGSSHNRHHAVRFVKGLSFITDEANHRKGLERLIDIRQISFSHDGRWLPAGLDRSGSQAGGSRNGKGARIG